MSLCALGDCDPLALRLYRRPPSVKVLLLFFYQFCDINFLTSRLIADLGGYHFPSALYKSFNVAVKPFLSAVDEPLVSK